MATRVLIVAASAQTRKHLNDGLVREMDIEVTACVADLFIARDLMSTRRSDLLLLDIEMLRLDGIEALRALILQDSLPVVVTSSMSDTETRITLDALDAGAVDFVVRPTGNGAYPRRFLDDLLTKLRANRAARVHRLTRNLSSSISPVSRARASNDRVIALGASTGGPDALREVLRSFPMSAPGIVIVQHMPQEFTRVYAARLNASCDLEVREAQDGDRVVPGVALLAPGGKQLRVVRLGAELQVETSALAKVNGHRPSVDVLFHSIAENVGARAAAAILTGMGADGAEGLLAMRKAGAYTIGQSEATCVIYGMPKVAFELGAVSRQLPLDEIGPALLRRLSAP